MTIKNQVFKFLHDHSNYAFTAQEVSKALGLNVHSVQRILKQLYDEADGTIERAWGTERHLFYGYVGPLPWYRRFDNWLRRIFKL